MFRGGICYLGEFLLLLFLFFVVVALRFVDADRFYSCVLHDRGFGSYVGSDLMATGE